MATYGSGGVQGGRALGNPKYNSYVKSTSITAANGKLATLNTGAPVEFDRVTGHQKITLFFGVTQPVPACSFGLTGGTNTQCSECLPMFPNPNGTYDRTINYSFADFQNGCIFQSLPLPPKTSKSVRINRFTVAVTSQNRYFILAMAPFSIVPSTITFPLTGTFVGYTSALAGGPQGNGVFLNVTSVSSGTILMPGQSVLGTTILAQVSGNTGDVGVYTLAAARNTASSTITLTQPTITTDIKLQINFYRGLPYMREGGMSISSGAPDYSERNFITTFPGNANPLDAFGALPFTRFSGQQDIVVTNLTTLFYFSFSIDYGILGQAGGYLGLASPEANAKILTGAENCVVDYIPVSIPEQTLQQTLSFLVTTATDPQGPRAYIFTFAPAPYTQTAPTIQLINNFPFGANSVEVKVVTRQFRTI